MTLTQLLKGAGIDTPPLDLPDAVSGIQHDSRRVAPGNVYVALKGQHADGHDHLAQAAEHGAILAVVSRPITPAPLPIVVVPNSRKALADLSCAFFDHPSQVLTLVGITGTNGKTTTAYQVEAVLAAAGHHAALLGTVETRLNGEAVTTVGGVSARTTPEAPDLQALLARLVRDGASAGVMEVSSHALAQSRVRGCHYDVGVFTNLTRDHLDFHGTMDDYFASKCQLFEKLCPRAAVINLDDPWGRKLAERLDRPMTFGINPVFSPKISPRDLVMDRHGIRFSVTTERGDIAIQSPLLGDYNVSNLLAAVGVGVALNLPHRAIEDGLANAITVPGRMQAIATDKPFQVVVDYAHTEDALKRLLTALRPLTAGRGRGPATLSARGGSPQPVDPAPGRIIVVIGCGGDRDTGKRAPMGKVAAQYADLAIFTADNPRSESAADICAVMTEGADAACGADETNAANKATHRTIIDRRQAIAAALDAAQPGDLVVIAGKGHETTQIIGDSSHHFDDRETVLTLLETV